ncbi:MAG: hypothetical protein XE08_0202 [Parcubacteria bacterium 32_520]|nr:MAG: hypothetical protein XE08_0202 [Parcubacteria bacterium 32_520]
MGELKGFDVELKGFKNVELKGFKNVELKGFPFLTDKIVAEIIELVKELGCDKPTTVLVARIRKEIPKKWKE